MLDNTMNRKLQNWGDEAIILDQIDYLREIII